MQTEEQRQKLDEVSDLINQFSDIAHRLGQKFKVQSAPFDVEGGLFQVARLKGTWELVWQEGAEVKDIRTTSVAIKRRFLGIAGEFFRRYATSAQEWEQTIDTDIVQGRKALEEVKKSLSA